MSPGGVPSIAGYRIERELGRGGQAVVYEAFQASTRRKVAIKFLRQGQHSAAAELARLERERAVLSTVSHPHVVGVIDRGIAGNAAYLVMELVHGEPFDTWARSAWRPANQSGANERQRRVLEAFAKVCSGVEAAHEKGIVHRDLKPSNVLVDHADEPHVLDFGVARSFALADGERQSGKPDATITVTGEFIGSMPWASPEQILGQFKPGPGSDVYALGVMLFQALTGEFPYDVAGTTSEVMRNITSVHPPTPGSVVSARLCRLADRDADGSRPAPALVSSELDAIVLKALAKRPEDRYAMAGALGQDIVRLLRGETPIAVAEESRRSMRRLGKSVGIAGAGVAVLAALVVLFGPRLWRYATDPSGGDARSPSVAQTQPRNITPRISVKARPAVSMDSAPPTPAPNQPISNMAITQVVLPIPAVAGLSGVRSWTLETRGARGSYSAMEMSPDGKQLAVASDDGTIRVLDADTGNLVQLLVGHRGVLRDLSWSVNGQLASCDRYAVWVWDTTTGKPLHYYEMRAETVAWSPDGKTLAFGTQSIVLVSPSESKLVRDLGKPQSAIMRLRWSPDGTKLGGGSADNSVCVWDAKTGALLNTLKGHTTQVHHVAWTADGVLCSGDTAGRMLRWDLASGQSSPLIPNTNYTAGPSGTFAISPNGERVWCESGFTKVAIIDRFAGTVVVNLKGHTNWVSAAAWSPDSSAIYTASIDRSVAKWNSNNGTRLWVAEGQQGSFYTCAVSPDGKSLAATGYPSDLWILNCETAEPRYRYSTGNGLGTNPFFALDWSPDGSTLVVSTDTTSLRRFSSSGGEESAPLVFEGKVRGVSYSPDGLRMALGVGSNLVIWDTKKNAEIRRWPVKGFVTPGVVWSPDGKHIAVLVTTTAGSATSSAVALVNPETGVVVSAPQNAGFKITWTPDGSNVYAPYPGAALLSAADLNPVKKPSLPGSDYQTSGAWSPTDEGVALALALDSGQVAVFDKTLTSRKVMLEGSCGTCDLAWTRDGKTLAQAGRFDAMVRFWTMPEGKSRGVFVPMSGGSWVCIGPDGRWLGPSGVAERLFVYAITDDGGRLMLPVAEFEKRFGVKTGEERGEPMPAAPVRPTSAAGTIPVR